MQLRLVGHGVNQFPLSQQGWHFREDFATVAAHATRLKLSTCSSQRLTRFQLAKFWLTIKLPSLCNHLRGPKGLPQTGIESDQLALCWHQLPGAADTPVKDNDRTISSVCLHGRNGHPA